MEHRKILSNACWLVKALVILFVIVAHTNFAAIQNPFAAMVLSRLSSVAVPLFLIVAGYFYHANKFSSFSALLKKKAVGLCLPWLFCGVLVYGYTALRAGRGLGFGAAARFLLGSGSYLTVLLVLQLLFYFFRNVPKAVLLWTCLGLSAVSILLSAAGFTAPVLEKLYMTDYLNVFNWCGFFALGYAAQDRDPEKLIAGIKKLWIPAAALWAALLVGGYFLESNFGYFSWLGFPMEFCSSILFLMLGLALASCRWLQHLGKYSFTVYLLHIQIVPIVAKFLGGHIIGVLVSPLITYAITFGAIWIICKIAGWLKLNKLTGYLLGVR